jgi:hypothetical protein
MTEQLRTAAPFMCKVDLSTADFRQNKPEDVSRTLAFVAVTHSNERLASVFVTAPDGLTLHVRKYGSRVASALPVVCLPGLGLNRVLIGRGRDNQSPTQAAAWRGGRQRRCQEMKVGCSPG